MSEASGMVEASMQAPMEISLEKQVDEFLSSRSDGERLLLFSSLPSLISGGAYAATQYLVTNAIKDVIFIVLLAFATVFVTLGTIYLRRRLVRTAVILFRRASPIDTSNRANGFGGWTSAADGPGDLLDLVFHRRAMFICAMVYGSLMGASPIILGMHFPDRKLQILLMLFMFCSNAVTGAVLYSTTTLLTQSWHLAKRLEIRLFENRTDAIRANADLLARISIVAALYIGLCQASVVFSVFSGPWVFAYAFFAFFVFLAIYHVPQIPIHRRLTEERDIALAIIDRARSKLFAAELIPQTVDELCKLNEIETRVSGASSHLGSTNAWLVASAGTLSFALPYISSAAKIFLPLLMRRLALFFDQSNLFDL